MNRGQPSPTAQAGAPGQLPQQQQQRPQPTGLFGAPTQPAPAGKQSLFGSEQAQKKVGYERWIAV